MARGGLQGGCDRAATPHPPQGVKPTKPNPTQRASVRRAFAAPAEQRAMFATGG